MFKKRSLQVSVVKTPNSTTTNHYSGPRRLSDSEIKLIKDVVKSVCTTAVLMVVVARGTEIVLENHFGTPAPRK